jgi:hypothetical protein
MKHTEELSLSPEESLQIIRQTIDLAKRNVRDNGFHLLLWGALVVVAGLVDFYFEQQLGATNQHRAWGVMPLVGVPVAILYELRRQRTQRSANLVHQWYGYVWLGFGITVPLVVLFALQQRLSPTPLIMAVTGFALFVSGILLQFRPVVVGAVVIWAGALASILLSPSWHSLIIAVAVGLGYLVPGFLLQRAKTA